jgi:hypothetical protein
MRTCLSFVLADDRILQFDKKQEMNTDLAMSEIFD